MAIQFICPNPKCNKLVQVSADKAGQRISCPMCRQMVAVPGGVGAQTATDQAAAEAYEQFLRGIKEHRVPDEDDAAPAPAAAKSRSGLGMRSPGPVVVPPAPRREAGGLEDLSALPRAEVALTAGAGGKGGWVRAWWRSPSPLVGSFWKHCLGAMRHPGADAGSVLAGGLCLAILTTYYRCLLGPSHLLPDAWGVPTWALLAGLGVLIIAMGGYCLFVCLSLTSAAVASGGRLETWLRPTAGRVLRMGALGVSVAVVYVLPVVTLPLLPLALLTLSLTHDARAFCFRWQARSAFAYGEGFAIVWLVGLVGTGVAVAVWVLVNWVTLGMADSLAATMTGPEQEAVRAVAWFVGAMVGGVLALLPLCGMARCAGLLARYRPAVLESLPVSCKSVVTVGIVAVCLVLAAIVGMLLLGGPAVPVIP